MGLLRKDGTIKGVRAYVYDEGIEDWVKEKATGFAIHTSKSKTGYGFELGFRQNNNGYDVEVELTREALWELINEIDRRFGSGPIKVTLNDEDTLITGG